MAEVMLAGGGFMADLDVQRADVAGRVLRAVPEIPSSSPTFIALAQRFDDTVFAGVETANTVLVAHWFAALDPERRETLVGVRPTLDLDPSDVEVYGRQKEGVAYNYAGPPSPTSSSTGFPDCSMSWRRSLKAGTYRPMPARRVFIDKPGTTDKRPLSIPAVRDRIVQAAVKLVLEPVFEADFLPCSFGFRPKRGVHDALQVLIDESWRGRRWVVESDIANCFEAIPHDRLVAAVEERISDRHVLRLLRSILRAGVMVDGSVRRSDTGTPQGAVVSAPLANIYLHRLDKVWQGGGGVEVLVRYCDDLVVICRSQQKAQQALAVSRDLLGGLGLELKVSKTRIVHLTEGGEGLNFLGFHHRWVSNRASSRSRYHGSFLARWPTRQAMQRARDRIRQLTARNRVRQPVEDVVGSLNRFLRGWAGFFRYGNSSQHFIDLRWYAQMRLARFVAKRHGRRPAFGRWVVGSPRPTSSA